MRENRTKETQADVADYLAAIKDPARRRDCEELAEMMTKTSQQPPKMWGSSIVGFGIRHYALAGGRIGEICMIGFSSRKGDISIYGVAGENANAGTIEQLRKIKRGKGCLYVSTLANIDKLALQKLIAEAVKRHRK